MPATFGRPSVASGGTLATDDELAAHLADTTAVHGITDTTRVYAQGIRADLTAATLGTVVDPMLSTAMWTTSGSGSLAMGDTSQAASGMPIAAKVITGGSGTTFSITRDLFLDANGKTFSFDILTDSHASQFDFYLAVNGHTVSTTSFARSQIELAQTGGGQYRTLRTGVLHTITIPVCMLGTNGSAPPTETMLQDVRAIQLGFKDDAGGASTFYVGPIRVHHDPLPAGVVWVFDDARYDTLTEAYPVLAASGYVGVSAIPTAQVGTTSGEVVSSIARMSWADLLTLQTAGWEHVSHTQNHQTLSSVSAATVRSEIRGARADMLANGMNPEGCDFLVYPGGQWDSTSLPIVAANCRAARSIISSNTNANGQNYEAPGIGELERLRTLYVTNTVTVATVKAVIDRLAARNGKAIFTFHSIADTNPGGDTYTWLSADFAEVVAYAEAAGLVSYKFSELWPILGA